MEAIATDSDSGRCWIGNAKAILKAIFFGAGQAAIPLVAKRMARTHLTMPAGLERTKPCIPAPHPAHVKVSASSATPSRSLLWYEQPSPLLVIWFLAEILPT